MSPECKFGKLCEKRLCQFRHKNCSSEPLMEDTGVKNSDNEENLQEGEIYCGEWKFHNDSCEVVIDECDAVQCSFCKSKICQRCSDEIKKKIGARKLKLCDRKKYCSTCLRKRMVPARTASSSSSGGLIPAEG